MQHPSSSPTRYCQRKLLSGHSVYFESVKLSLCVIDEPLDFNMDAIHAYCWFTAYSAQRLKDLLKPGPAYADMQLKYA